MSDKRFEIQGLDEALEELKFYPEKINSVTKKALKTAVQPVLKDIKSLAPSRSFARLVKYKLVKGGIKIGYFGSKTEGARGDEPPTWFKIYWNNYGTMDNRWKGHTFQQPVKKKSQGKSGVRFKLFFERATDKKENVVYNNFVKAVESEIEKLKK